MERTDNRRKKGRAKGALDKAVRVALSVVLAVGLCPGLSYAETGGGFVTVSPDALSAGTSADGEAPASGDAGSVAAASDAPASGAAAGAVARTLSAVSLKAASVAAAAASATDMVALVQPEGQRLVAGGTANDLWFKVLKPTGGDAASGTLDYQWYAAEGTTGAASGDAIPDEEYTSFTPSADQVGATTYYCVATLTYTDSATGESATQTLASNAATITVTYDAAATEPVIVSQPEGYETDLNAEAQSLVVAARTQGTPQTGAGELSYQWYRQPEGATEGTAIADNTGFSYTPPTTDPGTTGYYCIVTNNYPLGTETQAFATSDTATVTVSSHLYISTAEELLALANAVNAGNTYEGYAITLTGDIDLSTVCGPGNDWPVIGSYNSGYSFRGNFDGDTTRYQTST